MASTRNFRGGQCTNKLPDGWQPRSAGGEHPQLDTKPFEPWNIPEWCLKLPAKVIQQDLDQAAMATAAVCPRRPASAPGTTAQLVRRLRDAEGSRPEEQRPRSAAAGRCFVARPLSPGAVAALAAANTPYEPSPGSAPARPRSARSSYQNEQQLRWRLREAQEQLQATTAELARAKAMLAALQRTQPEAPMQRRLLTQRQQNQQVNQAELDVLRKDKNEVFQDLERLMGLVFSRRPASEKAEALRTRAEELSEKWNIGLELLSPGNPGGQPAASRSSSPTNQAISRQTATRAKKYWKVVNKFVRQFLGKAMRRIPPKHRLPALRVKELCDMFVPDFEGDGMSAHEVIMIYARKDEINNGVQSILEEKKRPRDEEAESKSYEEMEAEMKQRYDAAFEAAGGAGEAMYRFEEVNKYLRKFKRGRVCQDAGHEIMGLDALYDAMTTQQTKFVREVRRLAAVTKGQAVIPNLKGYDRARAKVQTKYGNNTACLTDLLRASIIYPGICELYDALIHIMKENEVYSRFDFKLMEVIDRFQHCQDGYRDISLLVLVNSVICELQLHVKDILNVKKQGGHKSYRVQRVVNELVFDACVNNNEQDIQDLLKAYDVDGTITRDKSGRAGLHYVCHHGSAVGCQTLILSRANPWIEDSQGILPFELALKAQRFDALELILNLMISKEPAGSRCLFRLSQQAMPWWVDVVANETTGSYDGQRWLKAGRLMVQVLTRHRAEGPLLEFMTSLTKRDSVEHVRALLHAGVDLDVPVGQESLADIAIQGGQMQMTRMLLSFRKNSLGLPCPACIFCKKETTHTHLRNAAKMEDATYASCALIAGAIPDHDTARCLGKRTPLMAFAAAGDLETCRDLIAHNAEVHWIDGHSCNAVHYARTLGHTEVLNFLTAQREPVEAPLRRIVTTADMVAYVSSAIQEGCCAAILRVVSTLKDMSAEMFLAQRVGPFRLSFLHLATQATKFCDPAGQACRALLHAMIDPCIWSTEGETPLHVAAGLGHRKVYELMYDAALAAHAQPETEAGDAEEQAGSDDQSESKIDEAQASLARLLDETKKILHRKLAHDHAEREFPKSSLDDDGVLWLRIAFKAFELSALSAKVKLLMPEKEMHYLWDIVLPHNIAKNKICLMKEARRTSTSGQDAVSLLKGVADAEAEAQKTTPKEGRRIIKPKSVSESEAEAQKTAPKETRSTSVTPAPSSRDRRTHRTIKPSSGSESEAANPSRSKKKRASLQRE